MTRPTDVAQRREQWPLGDLGLEDGSRELLRLHRVSPLPSVLPHPERCGAPFIPGLQPGFTPAQAFQRLAVRAPTLIHARQKHP